MNIVSTKLPKNLIEILVTLSPEEMANFIDQALNKFIQETEIPGFRKGKAPKEMVKQKIGQIKILEEAANLAINQKYPEIIIQEKLNPVGPPRIEIQKLAPDNPLVFKIIVPLMPSVKIGDYKKIKVKRKEIEIKEAAVDKALKELQQMRHKETLVQRPAQKGDKVEIDLEMFLDKVPLEDGQVKNLACILGEDFYIPGLSDNLIGLSRGETKEFTLKYPETHYDKKLAGKSVDFKIKVNNIYQIDLPALDNQFAQAIGNFKTLEELKQQIRKNIEEEAQLKEEERLEIEILEKLVKLSDFEEIPDILIEAEINKMIDEFKHYFEHQNIKFEDYLNQIKKEEKDLRQEFKPKAEQRIKTALAIHQLAKEQKIDISEAEVDKEVERLTNLYKNQSEAVSNLKSEAGRNYLKNLLLNKKVIEYLKVITSK